MKNIMFREDLLEVVGLAIMMISLISSSISVVSNVFINSTNLAISSYRAWLILRSNKLYSLLSLNVMSLVYITFF
jgi:hypothetical protein